MMRRVPQALAHEPQQSLSTSGAVRVLQQIRTEHQAVFYGPLLLAIKSSVVDVARAAMLSLRTCLAVLPASVVMPKDILAASLAQPCSLGMLCLLHELRVHVELYRASRCKLMDSDVALALFEDWERGLSAFMRGKVRRRAGRQPSAAHARLTRALRADGRKVCDSVRSEDHGVQAAVLAAQVLPRQQHVRVQSVRARVQQLTRRRVCEQQQRLGGHCAGLGDRGADRGGRRVARAPLQDLRGARGVDARRATA